ncbi:MAG: hypothetical protein J6Y02_20260 [Pseudobutyrivibrio sp.]|nr:hypothetical protein [Pseudobutyrivibrio sp.]
MSLYIDEKTFDISLTRGDTAIISVPLVTVTYIDGEPVETPYTPQPGDKLRFAMSDRYGANRDQVLIYKDIPISTLVLQIDPPDTKSLKFGKYKYDIEFTDAAGHVSTGIEAIFEVAKEVY